MLSLRPALVLPAAMVLAAAIAACGGGDGRSGAPGSRASSSSQSSSGPEPPAPSPSTQAPGAGPPETFSDRPQVDLDLAQGPADALPGFRSAAGTGAQDGRSFRLRLSRGDGVRAPARRVVAPGVTAVLVVATVRAPTELDGRAGVFCRGSEDGQTGYELSVDRTGRARLERVRDGRRTLLAGYQARIDAAVPPDAPLPLQLFCSGTGAQTRLGVVVGVKAVTFFEDPEPLAPGARARSGLVVSGESRAAADFAAFQLWIDRP